MNRHRHFVRLGVLGLSLASFSGARSSAGSAGLDLIDDDCLMMATVLGDQRVKSAAGSKTRASCAPSTSGFSCRFRFQDTKDTHAGPSAVDFEVVDDDQGILILRSPPIGAHLVFVYKKAARFVSTQWGLKGVDGVWQKQCTGGVKAR